MQKNIYLISDRDQERVKNMPHGFNVNCTDVITGSSELFSLFVILFRYSSNINIFLR